MNLVLSASLASAVFLSPFAGAQMPFHRFTGDDTDDRFGFSVAGAGDVNNDGINDFVVGAPRDDDVANSAGRATVYSGVDGSVLWIVDGESAGNQLGYSVDGAGDVNDDGFADVVFGAPYASFNGTTAGRVYVMSGEDGSFLHTLDGDDEGDQFGWSVAGVGDVNDDNYADFIVGSYGDDTYGLESGSARVYSGADGLLIYSFNGTEAFSNFGYSLDSAGDVNNDAYPDIIVGAPFTDQSGINSGSAWVYSGFDGSELHCFLGAGQGDEFGRSVSGAGDVNDDEFDDVVVGVPRPAGVGNTYVFSGLDGTTLHTLAGTYTGGYFGAAVSGVGDADNDGHGDFVVGAWGADEGGPNVGVVTVYSGASGDILTTIIGESTDDYHGYSLDGGFDVTHNGWGDLARSPHETSQF